MKRVRFDELDAETWDDVTWSIAGITGEDLSDVQAGLTNGPAMIPMAWVDPKILYDPGRSVSRKAVREYAKAWKGGSKFPPVVIDSSGGLFGSLLEGGHRVASAVKAGVHRIRAIDLAGVHVMKTRDGLETYGFRGDR